MCDDLVVCSRGASSFARCSRLLLLSWIDLVRVLYGLSKIPLPIESLLVDLDDDDFAFDLGFIAAGDLLSSLALVDLVHTCFQCFILGFVKLFLLDKLSLVLLLLVQVLLHLLVVFDQLLVHLLNVVQVLHALFYITFEFL